MFSNTQNVNIFGLRPPLCRNMEVGTPQRKHRRPFQPRKITFLLHINHILDLKNSELHKHHLLLSLDQTPNCFCFFFKSSPYNKSVHTWKSKGPASLRATRLTWNEKCTRSEHFLFFSCWWNFTQHGTKKSLIGQKLSCLIKGVEDDLRWNRPNNDCFQHLGQNYFYRLTRSFVLASVEQMENTENTQNS